MRFLKLLKCFFYLSYIYIDIQSHKHTITSSENLWSPEGGESTDRYQVKAGKRGTQQVLLVSTEDSFHLKSEQFRTVFDFRVSMFLF